MNSCEPVFWNQAVGFFFLMVNTQWQTSSSFPYSFSQPLWAIMEIGITDVKIKVIT